MMTPQEGADLLSEFVVCRSHLLDAEGVQEPKHGRESEWEACGVELLIRMTAAVTRDLLRRTTEGTGHGGGGGNRVLLAPETQIPAPDDGAASKRRKKMVPETLAMLDEEGPVAEDKGSRLRMPKKSLLPLSIMSDREQDRPRRSASPPPSSAGVFGNGRSPSGDSQLGAIDASGVDEREEDVHPDKRTEAEDPDFESPSLLRRKDPPPSLQKSSADSSEAQNHGKRKAAPGLKVTNRFGVQVEQASPSQLRRMRNMKQGKINFNKGATRKKKKKSRDHGEAESEEDEDAEMREAKKQSLLTARKEEEQRKKSGGRNANSDDDDFKTTPVKKGVPKRPVVSVADFDKSFDCLPEPGARGLAGRVRAGERSPTFKHVRPTERNRAARKRMKAFDCKECEEYYRGASLSEEEMEKLMAACSRHRSHDDRPPPSPQDFMKLHIDSVRAEMTQMEEEEERDRGGLRTRERRQREFYARR